ncbi:MFS general substrate transporter [Trametes versicolor FP-101664 SS1]|uniref:MFS general substrate transporter n=1 Tax=Trametes versicolor (strain FP-101664) TaxID=717944 RepID=UPI000462341D|nr:MFS general substrate transporter [Trametes versicolor FP-101664 SS1]EIW52779.1 MFS general substrate transporter [Trametes versicolor FP-101664 SS1]
MTSLVIMQAASAMMQISFFIVVSSSNAYAQHLGGTSTFSGLVIGIPTAFSGMALLPLMKYDQGGYRRPLHFACATAILGNVLYSLAYHANYLYLILLGRIISGFSFTFFMYSKRYCSDPRIVGIRRRTTLAGWLVLGQGVGFSIGPLIGGLLYKIGFSNSVFNGYTAPTWILAGVWAVFWAVAARLFEDVPRTPPSEPTSEGVELQHIPSRNDAHSLQGVEKPENPKHDEEAAEVAVPAGSTSVENLSSPPGPPSLRRMSAAQIGVTATMGWFAMTCFFILGGWEANLPVFTGSASPLNPFHYSPFAAGNFIAAGGAATIPFLLANLFAARRVQDRHTLAVGTTLGLAGLLAALAILAADKVSFGALFVCWFLVALGFNLSSTVTLSLLSKQIPGEWNTKMSLVIQYSNYTGRVSGAVWGGAGVQVGMLNYVGLQIAIVGVGMLMFSTLWKQLKAKTG